MNRYLWNSSDRSLTICDIGIKTIINYTNKQDLNSQKMYIQDIGEMVGVIYNLIKGVKFESWEYICIL